MAGCSHPHCIRGFLLLIPFRKNCQNQPTWIPIAEINAMALMASHLRFLQRVASRSSYMFLPMVPPVTTVASQHVPGTGPDDYMTVNDLRALIRRALCECCDLSPQQAARFGTHSLKIGAVEVLRARGASAELRQQLGGWMSASVALRYLQLSPGSQFDVLYKL